MANLYQAKSGFLKRTIAGEEILVPVGATTQEFNGMIMLNVSGSYMWDLLQNPISKDDLIAKMKNVFDAETSIIAADVDEFLENGIREQLIIEL